jgi:hypothetical protein
MIGKQNEAICTLVQVGDWRKYALEEHNIGLICIFHIVHNRFNTMLVGNIDIGVVLND